MRRWTRRSSWDQPRLRRGSPFGGGRLFAHGGTRRGPPPPNRGGARSGYCVPRAGRQKTPPPLGLVSRVPAAEIEALVVAALRNHLNASGAGEQLPNNDR